MCLRAISSSSKSVTVVPSSTLPKRLTMPASDEDGRGELGLAGAGVTDERDVSDAGGVVDLHSGIPRTGASVSRSVAVICGAREIASAAATQARSDCRRASAQRLACPRARRVYSYRSASIGSRREALTAGYMPKKMPTEAEKPRPMANDHQGSEMGKPETRWTAQPMRAAERDAEHAADRGQERGLHQELKQNLARAARRAPCGRRSRASAR